MKQIELSNIITYICTIQLRNNMKLKPPYLRKVFLKHG